MSVCFWTENEWTRNIMNSKSSLRGTSSLSCQVPASQDKRNPKEKKSKPKKPNTAKLKLVQLYKYSSILVTNGWIPWVSWNSRNINTTRQKEIWSWRVGLWLGFTSECCTRILRKKNSIATTTRSSSSFRSSTGSRLSSFLKLSSSINDSNCQSNSTRLKSRNSGHLWRWMTSVLRRNWR